MSKTREALDLEYENGGFILDAESYPPRWEAAAEAFRNSTACDLDVAYGDHARERYDLFFPEAAPKGLMVFIHGGYWKARSKEDWSHFAGGGVAAGWAVAMIGYPLAPDRRISQITASVAAAITAAAARVSGPIAVSGHSAGGHLTARMSMPDVLPAQIGARVARAVAISPVSDLRPLLPLTMNETLHLDQEEAETESPVLGQPLAHIAITSLVGAEERPAFLDQARWLSEAWHCDHVILPGRHHFDVIDPLLDPESRLMRALLA